MVPERKRDGNLRKDREMHGEVDLWSTAQTAKDLMISD